MDIQFSLLILILAGFALGIFSALFGVGGGVIIVPVLQMVFPGMLPQEWVGTSFAVILLTTCLNSYLFVRGGFKVYKDVLLALGLGLTMGVVSGQQISFLLPVKVFYVIFGLTLFLLGAKRLFIKKKAPRGPKKAHSAIATTLAGFGIGVLSGLVGIGGGTLIIPYLMFASKVPVKSLSFHSNMVMIVGSLFGVFNMMLQSPPPTERLVVPLGQFTIGYIHWGLALCFFLGIIATAKLGIKLGKKISEERTDKTFAVILFALGLRFLYQAIF